MCVCVCVVSGLLSKIKRPFIVKTRNSADCVFSLRSFMPKRTRLGMTKTHCYLVRLVQWLSLCEKNQCSQLNFSSKEFCITRTKTEIGTSS